MNQYHYVVFFDEGRKQWYVDWGTTNSAFMEGTAYNRQSEKWWKGHDDQVVEHYNELLLSLNAKEYY